MAAAPGAGRVVAGRYRIVSELGRGGTGVVWLAEDELIHRQVALKELRAPSDFTAPEREVFTMRVLSEARNAARVDHPNAVALYDVIPASAEDEAAYLVMEMIRALSLADLIARDGKLPEQRVVAIARQLLDVLDAAHALGIVHRDVKPANILLAPGDTVKLTDFGIAHTVTDARLTKTNVVLGTPAYLAPELLQGGHIEPPADLWSVGATLYLAAEGAAPFDRQTVPATLNAILFEPIPAPSCGRPLRDAIAALLVRDPAQRARSVLVRGVLDGAVSPPPWQGALGPTVPDPVWQQQVTPGYPVPPPNWPQPPFPPGPHTSKPHTSATTVLASVVAVIAVAGLIALAIVLANKGSTGSNTGLSSSLSPTPTPTPSYSPASSDTPTPDAPSPDTPSLDKPSSDAPSPSVTAFDPGTLDNSSTDPMPFTTQALLPNSFTDGKGIEYTLVSGDEKSCIEPDMTSNVQQVLGDNDCTVSMTGQYLESGSNVTSTNDVLVSVQIFPFNSATTAVQVYKTIVADSSWDFGIFCTRSGDGLNPCTGNYHQAKYYEYIETQHRYLIEATAMYTDLASSSAVLPWIRAAAYRADEVCGPAYYIESQ